MAALDRRQLLKAGAALALPILLGRCGTANGGPALLPHPSGVLDLPEGFELTVLQRAGAAMSDGLRVPERPDGMGCFAGVTPGTLVLMRNHELEGSGGAHDPGAAPPEAYDPEAVGGVTRLLVDAVTLEVLSSNLVLTGTRRNCAGGASPWGWLTCEEDVSSGHGFVFLCDPAADRVAPAVRISAWGRMNHEAAVVDPDSGIAYLTEDRPDSCFYRFVPELPDAVPGPGSTGRLQALRIVGEPARDMNVGVADGARFEVDWVDLEDAESPGDDLRVQARGLGAAVFRRGEGIFLHAGAVFFTATTGGPAEAGQVWRHEPASNLLELIAQSPDRSVLDMPDNLCVAPWGDIVLAEDGRWPDQYVRVLTADGRILDLARNALSSAEIAGVCFSPSGDTLFLNLQGEGITLAIRGPFQQFAAAPPPVR